MPDTGTDKTTAVAYPPEDLYEMWCRDADERDLSRSQYIIRMVETGRKKFDINAFADESLQELRQQRADLREELQRERERIEQLEQQLHRTIHTDIIEFVENNPGVTTAEIIQHIADSVPARVVGHLDTLEGSELVRDDEGYHPSNTSQTKL